VAPVAPAAQAYRPRLDLSGNTNKAGFDGLRISPARSKAKGCKGALLAAAAACLVLGIWGMVHLSQSTPQAAAGAGKAVKAHPADRAKADAPIAAARSLSPAAAAAAVADAAVAAPATMPACQDRVEISPAAPTTMPTAVEPEIAVPAAPTTMPAPAAVIDAPESPAAPAADEIAAPAAAAPAPTTMPAAAPAAPTTRPAAPTFRQAPEGFSLGAVMKSAAGNLAVINGKPVREGAVVRGAKVIEIQPLFVELELNGERFTLGLGRSSNR
jgi:hypothetical protein